jgi:hypothetical protein
MNVYVFISHSSKDNNIVKKIINVFEKYYINYWVDLDQTYNDIKDITCEINKGFENHLLQV